MAKRRASGNEEEGLLFDLPLRPDTKPEIAEFDEALGGGKVSQAAADTLLESADDVAGQALLDDAGQGGEADQGSIAQVVPIQTKLFQDEDDEGEFEDGVDSEGESGAPLSDRLLGGVSDLAVHVAMLGVAAAGSYGLGVQISLADWPPLLVLMLIFSFLYWTIPLAFWGQTPGMAWIGSAARSLDDEPLSFGQAIMRWVGALITVGLAGLPVLLSLGGRSLSDWLSESKTVLV